MLINNILNLPRDTKRLIVLGVDLLLLPLALWISFSLRLGELYVPVDKVIYLFLALPVIAVPVFGRFGLYRAIIRYIGFRAMWAVIQAVSLYTLVLGSNGSYEWHPGGTTLGIINKLAGYYFAHWRHPSSCTLVVVR